RRFSDLKSRRVFSRLKGRLVFSGLKGRQTFSESVGRQTFFRIWGPADIFQDMGAGREISGFSEPADILMIQPAPLSWFFLFFSESFIGFQDTADDGL
ncbi:hypothetical protein J5839_05110, partial [Methanosarcinaceae archaeon]|nr:hypothetical protein [Methanosarcinaceae archaeon]